MATFKRPGVYLEEVLTPASATNDVDAESIAAFVGVSNRGPLGARFLSNWSEFLQTYGDFANSPVLAHTVFQFFGGGGNGVYISRVADQNAVAASRTLTDTAATPASTLKVEAINPGTWGNDLYLDVNAGLVDGRFDLVIKSGGTGASSVVERYVDLSMDEADNRYAVALVNSQSLFVTLTDMSSTTEAPNNAPAVQVNTTLTGGSDGAAVDASDWQRAVSAFDLVGSPLVMNLAGPVAGDNANDLAIINSATAYARNRGTIFVVIDGAKDDTAAEAVTNAGSLAANSYGAVYYPWIKVNDPSKNTPGLTKSVAPGGSVVGLFMRTDALRGPFKTPAGITARLSGAVDVERKLTDTELDNLNTAPVPVNVIRPVTNSGIVVMGGRTLQGGFSDRYVAIRRSLIYIKKSLKDLTEFAVFEPNDEVLWDTIRSILGSFLAEYHGQGGLRGTAENAFYVKCDGVVNTTQSIANGEVRVEVGVALEYPAEYVVIRVGQFEGGASLTEA